LFFLRPALPENDPLIGVVGVCASGKSTLTKALSAQGYRCRHIAQEHSYVQDMWRRLTDPDILIYLEVSYEKTLERKRLNWTRAEYEVQLQRLRHAWQHADIHIHTDPLSPVDLLATALAEIQRLLPAQG
jgi:deoxyadenosine/deoxycytidine kinase